jgi:hypothetical protein
MISHLTYQAGQAHLEDIRRHRAEHPGVSRNSKVSSIRARFTALTARRHQRRSENVLAGAVTEHRLPA